MSLEIQSATPEQGVLTLHTKGRLDSDSASIFDSELSTCLAPELRVLAIDLTGLEYISSAGIRCLFTARMAMDAQDGRLLLVGPQPAVRKVLDMVRIVEPTDVLEDTGELERLLS